MAPASSAPPGEETVDLANAVAALGSQRSDGESGRGLAEGPLERKRRCRSTRRALLHIALGGLLIAGVFAILDFGTDDADGVAMLNRSFPGRDVGSQADIVFNNARTGDCLSWAKNAPDRPSFVECSAEHLFEVAEPVDMRNFQEPCGLVVRPLPGVSLRPEQQVREHCAVVRRRRGN